MLQEATDLGHKPWILLLLLLNCHL